MKVKQPNQPLYCGIDISGDTIDVCIQHPGQDFESATFSNSISGFKQLWKRTGLIYQFVMEATGVYHLPLCFFLEAKKSRYSVVNALQIKRYIQMKLERSKTDKKDARHICMYGIDHGPECYEMPSQLYFECRVLNNAIETTTKQITAYRNKLHSLSRLNIDSKVVTHAYNKILNALKAEQRKLEAELDIKLRSWQQIGRAHV